MILFPITFPYMLDWKQNTGYILIAMLNKKLQQNINHLINMAFQRSSSQEMHVGFQTYLTVYLLAPFWYSDLYQGAWTNVGVYMYEIAMNAALVAALVVHTLQCVTIAILSAKIISYMKIFSVTWNFSSTGTFPTCVS